MNRRECQEKSENHVLEVQSGIERSKALLTALIKGPKIGFSFVPQEVFSWYKQK